MKRKRNNPYMDYLMNVSSGTPNKDKANHEQFIDIKKRVDETIKHGRPPLQETVRKLLMVQPKKKDE